ncbi:MAG: hypothetical protein EXS16_21825 [Gemmataceae bacterium]|nr:hypothetical protein [Gemmataceae bacterium]
MANTGKLIGADYSIARDSGSWAAPAHIPLIGAKDIKITAKPAGEADASDRVSTPVYEKKIPIRHNVEWSFNALWNGGAGLAALRNALIAGTAIRLALMNRRPAATTTGGGVGYRGDWLIKKGSFKFGLRDAQTVDFAGCPHGDPTNAVVSFTDATTTLGTAETQATKKIGSIGSVNDSANAPITAIKDISLDIEWDTCDATDRTAASPDDYDAYMATRIKLSAGIAFQWKEDDTQLVAFRTAWKANSAILLSILDGAYATAGSWGVGAAGGVSWSITDYPLDANLTDGQLYSVKLVPAGNYTVAPAFLTTS